MSEQRDLPAGGFLAWMAEIQAAMRGEGASDVPCGDCTACCTSSQFIHIQPDETETLAHVPAKLLFPAPQLPPGHVLLGYDEQGCCPMLVDGACSIYDYRPRTCRVYDCRIFPATGIDIDGDGKSLIARRARRWRFDYPTEDDRDRHESLWASARHVEQQADVGKVGGPTNPTQLAVRAIEVHHVFLRATTGGPDR